MGQFVISDPQGQKYQITAPDGASQDEAMAWGRKQIESGALKPSPGPEAAADISSKVSNLADKVPGVGKAQDFYRSKMQDIDRKGLPFGLASEIMGGDTDAEKLTALRTADPKATLESDLHGRPYAVMGDGKKVYVEPYSDGGVTGALKATGTTMGEQAIARPGEVGGMVLGGTMGSIPGAAAGAGLGYLADQGVKGVRNLFQKTPGQTAMGAGEAAIGGGLSEATGKVLTWPLRGALPKWLTGATDESLADTKELMSLGGQARYKQSAPGLAAAEYKVAEAERLGMTPDQANVAATKEKIRQFLEGRGVQDSGETVAAAKGGQSPYLGEGVQSAYGAPIVERVQASRKALADAVGASEKDLADIQTLNDQSLLRHQRRSAGLETDLTETTTADKRGLQDAQLADRAQAKSGLAGAKGQLKEVKSQAQMDFERQIAERRAQMDSQLAAQINVAKGEAETSLQALRSSQGRPSSDLQTTVGSDVRRAQQDTSKAIGTQYQTLYRDGVGIVGNVTPISAVAKKALDSMKGPDGNYLTVVTAEMAPRLQYLEQIASMGGQELPIGQLADLRTALYDLGGVRKLLGSSKQHLIDDLYKAAGEAVDGAYFSAPDDFLSPVDRMEMGKKFLAVKAPIDKQWSEYKTKFGDALFERLTKQAGTTGSVESENVIDMATRNPSQFKRLWNVLPSDKTGQITRQRIARGIFDDMVGKSTKGQEINAQAFADQLKGNAPILKMVFGDQSPRIVEAANGLLLADGKLPLNNLAPENVLSALKTATKTQEEMNKYFSKHSLALLAQDEVATNRAVQEAQKLVADKTSQLESLKTGQLGARRALEDQTTEAKQALKDQIAEAGNKVSAEGTQRIEIGRQKLEANKQSLKDFDMTRFAKEMSDPNYLRDKAPDFVVQPKEEELLSHAFALFGPESPQIKAAQESFLKKAIASGVNDISDPKAAFSGDKMRSFLSQYTGKQKRMLLDPYGGEKDLLRLADFFDTAFPVSRSDVAAGFAAGAKKARIGPMSFINPKNWPQVASYGSTYLKGYLLNSPFAFKLLVNGFEPGPVGQTARQTFEQGLRAYIQTSAAQKKY